MLKNLGNYKKDETERGKIMKEINRKKRTEKKTNKLID